ncbi:hypothetical protein BGX31_009847 [Mortierella sp. GBA43]|nr:hypothetical protein BGX31_009847 [Mortierella sp. GBA43]
MSSASSFLKPFRIPDMTSAEEEGSASSPLSALSTQFPKAQHQRRPRPSRRTRASTSESSSDSGESDKESSKDSENAAQRIQHAENQRDRERGGSRTLTSEIYAVLRRFRKENGLVNHVREIYMDGTDSDQYPSPLVMLIKFPHLEILSSRHRRKQTSLTTDIHTLKAMLRDGRVAPYSLRLRRWDIFHPYMTEMVEEDVAGFQGILNAISIVGAELNETRPPSEKEPASDSKKTKGVQLDIRLCHGPGRTRLASTAMSWINNTNGTFAGVGMHWGSATGQNTLGSQTETNTSTTTTHSSVAPPQICGNIKGAEAVARLRSNATGVLINAAPVILFVHHPMSTTSWICNVSEVDIPILRRIILEQQQQQQQQLLP